MKLNKINGKLGKLEVCKPLPRTLLITMLQVTNLSKSYGQNTLFRDVSFSINAGERVGLVGRNGHGKTTLFKIFTGEEEADSGSVSGPRGYRIGHLSQHLSFQSPTVIEEILSGPISGEEWEVEHRAKAILQGLGFNEQMISSSPLLLSGGFQIRLNLVKLLVSQPNLLLLDEPTNYLDILSLRWLADFLNSWSGELMLITHDHGFMDQVTTHTLGIHRGSARKIAGSTQKYFEQLAMEEEVHAQSVRNQQKKIEHVETFIRTFRAKASKAKAVQSRIRALERMDKLESLEAIDELSFRFAYDPSPNKVALQTKHLSFAYGEASPRLIEDLTVAIASSDRIGIIGRNGKGKSTLLRLLAGELKPIDGELSYAPNTKLAYFGQTNVERLTSSRTVEEELMSCMAQPNRTVARTIAGIMMFEGDNALKHIRVLSGGEKSRVSLGKIILSPANLLLLDEPTNHLDMYSSEALLEALDSFPGAVMIVTHSELFLRELATKLIVFDRGEVTLFDGGYDDFLERVGWSDDAVEKKKTFSTKDKSKESKKSSKDKSPRIGNFQKESQRIEKRIEELDAFVAEKTDELVSIATKGYRREGADLANVINDAKKELDELYERLDQVLQEIDKDRES